MYLRIPYTAYRDILVPRLEKIILDFIRRRYMLVWGSETSKVICSLLYISGSFYLYSTVILFPFLGINLSAYDVLSPLVYSYLRLARCSNRTLADICSLIRNAFLAIFVCNSFTFFFGRKVPIHVWLASDKWLQIWNEATFSDTKLFIPDPLEFKKSKTETNYSYIFSQFLTGHGNFRKYLHDKKLRNSSTYMSLRFRWTNSRTSRISLFILRRRKKLLELQLRYTE